jgi:ribosome recycling factor
MLTEIKKDARTRMAKSLEALRHELAKIRTGRAHPSLLEHIHVDYYGSQVPISQVAKKMTKMKNELTKLEVSTVSKRISSLGSRLPIPKGIDPYKARPDRKAARGR